MRGTLWAERGSQGGRQVRGLPGSGVQPGMWKERAGCRSGSGEVLYKTQQHQVNSSFQGDMGGERGEGKETQILSSWGVEWGEGGEDASQDLLQPNC